MTEVINSAVIDELKDLLAEGFGVLVDRFIADGQTRINKIEQALAEQDVDVVYAEAHGLKGSCRNVGAEQMADYCGQLEAMGQVQNLAGAEPIFSAVVTNFAAVSQRLQDYADA
ncbi:MAG TPA: Hpt domain-containing protein [Marinagarivorans sp.]